MDDESQEPDMPVSNTKTPRGLLAKVLPVVLILSLVAVGAFFAFNAFLSTDAPAEFEVSEALDAVSTLPGQDEGASSLPQGVWTIGSSGDASFGLGYRILEDIPVGGPEEVVGRSTEVEGELTLNETFLESASLSVAVETLASGVDLRDDIVANNYLKRDNFPTLSFELTDSVDISQFEGLTQAEFRLTGELSLAGVTNQVEIPVEVQWNVAIIEIVGSFDVTLSDFEIERPDLVGRTARETATVEFKLQFESQ